MPPCPPLNPSPPKCPLVPRLNPKGLSNIWNRETSQHMPPCPPLNPSPPKSPLVPRLNPKGLSNIFKLLLFRGECDPFWFRGECDPLLGANVTPVPSYNGCSPLSDPAACSDAASVHIHLPALHQIGAKHCGSRASRSPPR